MQRPATAHPAVRRGFSGKIILIVLTIIALSQALGTFLSVLSFEEIYLETLISKYEILGKDLNRRIEQALKFGKPLDRFLGMDRLAETLFRRADELAEVSIFDKAGRPLFSFQKAQAVMARVTVDDSDDARGRVLLDRGEPVRPRSTEGLAEREGPWPRIHLDQGRYRLLFPIKAPFSGLQGYLELAFDRSVLDARKWALVRRSLAKLLVAVALTGIAVALLIRFLFVIPARRQSERVEAALFERRDESPQNGPPSGAARPVSEEMLHLQQALEGYMALTEEARREVLEKLRALERTLPESDPSTNMVRLMKETLPEEERP